MFRSIFLILMLLSLSLHAKDTIVITGSSTIAPVISDLAKFYEAKNKDVRIDVQTGGSSRGIADARKDLSNIGMVSRALKPDEKDLNNFTFALDGIAIIVHKTNPISQLSKEQIVDIYKGEINNWKVLKGADQKIVVVNKAEGRSTLELFIAFFGLKNSEIKADIVIGDNEQGIKTVSTNKNSIAYVSIGTAEYNASVGVPLKLLDFQGMSAKVENIKNGTYPLTRELNLVTKLRPTGHIDGFIKFVMSPEARSIIKDQFFVPTH